jgi:hypothetical protein
MNYFMLSCIFYLHGINYLLGVLKINGGVGFCKASVK